MQLLFAHQTFCLKSKFVNRLETQSTLAFAGVIHFTDLQPEAVSKTFGRGD